MRVAKQHAQIMVGPNVQVSKAYENRRHSEVILAADPNHGDRLLAGSMVLDPGTVKGDGPWLPTRPATAEGPGE